MLTEVLRTNLTETFPNYYIIYIIFNTSMASSKLQLLMQNRGEAFMTY